MLSLRHFPESTPLPPHRAWHLGQLAQQIHGSAGITNCAARSVSTAPIGSHNAGKHAAEKRPYLCVPPPGSGMEMIAPLGEILNGNAKGTGQVRLPQCLRIARKKAGTYITPTAIPSGMLCKGHRQHHHRGAAELAFRTLRWSHFPHEGEESACQHEQKQHADPKIRIKAGRKDSLPIFSDCSIAGISRLQMDAATITSPAAKPARERCTSKHRVTFS